MGKIKVIKNHFSAGAIDEDLSSRQLEEDIATYFWRKINQYSKRIDAIKNEMEDFKLQIYRDFVSKMPVFEEKINSANSGIADINRNFDRFLKYFHNHR